MDKCIQRLPALIDKHAQRQECRSADPVLAVDQDFVAALQALPDERHTPLEMLMGRGFKIRGRQVKQLDPGAPQCRLIVTFFSPKINDCCDAVALPEVGCMLHGEAGAERQLLGQPVEIGTPFFF